ncbi:MAG: amidohydrolase family protein [Gammaproteobacteria bacterium]|nr:amidohydrolase family protein [Gammaproteobacteria bacterium]
MWIRKTAKDKQAGEGTPIPTQIVSNEEIPPLPQTEDQKAVEQKIRELADQFASKLGITRREFLKTSGGMVTGFLAMNAIHGCAYKVTEEEALHEAAYLEGRPKNQFIFDAQTHHVKDSITGPMMFRKLTAKAGLNPALLDADLGRGTLHRGNFVKEIFFDSDTVMAIMTGATLGPPEHYALPAEEMVKTRDMVNAAAGSQRMLSHGLANPVEPSFVPEGMDWQVEELGIDGWKCYTGNPSGAWRMDDEAVAYPFFEKSLELGIKNISLHKGLPLPGRFESYFNVDDIMQAAKDFPDINFIIYHSGMKHMMTMIPPGESGIDEDGNLPWTTDLVRMQKENPDVTNVYAELGAVFGHSVVTHPEICGHLMGQLMDGFGPEKIIWGTDCIWWGSPQWLIEAFRRYQMPEELKDKYGYVDLTAADRELIFGRNIAGLYGVDIEAARTEIPGDSLSSMKSAYINEGPEPSNTQYGWVAV